MLKPEPFSCSSCSGGNLINNDKAVVFTYFFGTFLISFVEGNLTRPEELPGSNTKMLILSKGILRTLAIAAASFTPLIHVQSYRVVAVPFLTVLPGRFPVSPEIGAENVLITASGLIAFAALMQYSTGSVARAEKLHFPPGKPVISNTL
ncbi:MAG: hypothetical protein R2756_07680 [Bacteroidales bacterium]